MPGVTGVPVGSFGTASPDPVCSRLLGVSRQAARQRFQSLAPKVGSPLPPHLAGRTPWEADVIRINESSADVRRRAEFEGDDPIFW